MAILEGIKVIELCEVYQGPLTGQALADFGARVIKVERPPVGDPMRLGDFHAAENNLMSGYFAAVNRSKECVCLDLKNEAGRAALLELAKTADVLLHNYRPGVMERLGTPAQNRIVRACGSAADHLPMDHRYGINGY